MPVTDGATATGAVLAPRSDIADITADDSFVYLLRHRAAETVTTIELLPTSFAENTMGTMVELTQEADEVTTSSVQYPLYAFAVPGKVSANQIVTVDLRDASATQQAIGIAVDTRSFTWTTDEGGVSNLLYLEESGGAWAINPRNGPDASVLVDMNGFSVASTAPMDGGATCAIGESAGAPKSITAGPLFAQHPVAALGMLGDPAELLVVDGRVVWQDTAGNMYVSGAIGAADAGAPSQLLDGGAIPGSPHTFGAADHKVYWLSSVGSGGIYSATLGPTSFTTAPAPVTLADGTQPTAVTGFTLNSTTLFWTDADGVHRVALGNLPGNLH